MEKVDVIVKRIERALPRELGGILNELNNAAYQENDWDSLSVRASYSDILAAIDYQCGQCKQYLDFGNETMDVYDCKTGETYTLNVRQAITNLKLAQEFFTNPPVVENPNSVAKLKMEDVEKIDWSKPVYTADEVKTLLHVSDNTFRKWLNGGWIPYSQMDGSDKKLIEKENLLKFLRNPKIFYPSSQE